MAMNRPHQLAEHSSPPFPPHTPDPEHEAATFHRSSLSRAENAIKEILFGDAKVKTHAVHEHVHRMQQREAAHHDSLVKPAESPSNEVTSSTCDQKSPSMEADQAETANQNGFGDDSSFGWPGMGTWHGFSTEGRQAQGTPRGKNNRDDKLEAVMREAIDEAAGESYGWPGLGSWPPPKRA